MLKTLEQVEPLGKSFQTGFDSLSETEKTIVYREYVD